MQIVKIERAPCDGGDLYGTKVTVETDIADTTDPITTIQQIERWLRKSGYEFLPLDTSSYNGLYASTRDEHPSEEISGAEAVKAWEWLATAKSKKIVLGLDSIFVNAKLHVWFADFWVLDPAYKLIK